MASGRGVVAAGHPITARTGARVLEEGGNAADAAVAAVLASCVCESPLTGLGAGGYAMLHGFGEDVLLDFFVAVPGAGGTERTSELVAVPVWFTPETSQEFYVGAASCAVPGVPAGLEALGRRFCTVALAELAAPAARLAREGVEVNRQQAYIIEILAPILTRGDAGRRLYAPADRPARPGDVIRSSELAEAIALFGAEGAAPFYRGEIARRMVDQVGAGGGTLALDDLEAYEPVAREPVRVAYRGCEVLTNPPPSAGGVLIAYVLALLERVEREAGRPARTAELVRAMDEAQAVRGDDFARGLVAGGVERAVLDEARLDAGAERILAGERAPAPGTASLGGLGQTTHITVVDGEGRCASVTCSNGSGSGVYVDGTGIQVNNMLGEEDLNPLGFHRLPSGSRMPSMMAPTAILSGGGVLGGLGSGGSNRIRSAIVQVIRGLLDDDLGAREAVEAPRVHLERSVVHAEPGFPPEALEGLSARGFSLELWREPNLFFGGVHTVARDPRTGELAGAGDPRRGGAVAIA